MDFEEFKERAVSEIGNMMGEGQAELYGIKRNNGVTLTGLTAASPGAWIAPVVALEGYYEELCQGADFGQVIRGIWQECVENREGPGIDIPAFTKWERAKENVAVKLVNYKANIGLLGTVPHKRVLDLAEVYYHVMPTDSQQLATILINSQHMEMWGIGAQELASHAYVNTQKYFPAEIHAMAEILQGFPGTVLPGIGEGVPMYVVTNRLNQYGACAMLFPKALKGLADKWGCDLYILPSSVHEVIALPALNGDADELAKTVKEVNASMVLPEEKLSDTVYRYCHKSGKVEIA